MTEVPIKVAVQYSHKFVITPDNTAGARERAGFIEAPDMNAKKNMSKPTIPPITIPLKPPQTFGIHNCKNNCHQEMRKPVSQCQI